MTMRLLAAGILFAVSWLGAINAQAAIKHDVNIRAQGLGPALADFARQTGIQVVYAADLVEGLDTKALTGSMTPEEALTTLIAETRLKYEFVDEKTVTVMSVAAEASTASAKKTTNLDAPKLREMRLAQSNSQAAAENPEELHSEETPSVVPEEKTENLDEVVVTGTNFPGLQPVAAQLMVIDRKEIDRSGLATVEEVVRTLPQNFQGDVSDDTAVGFSGTNSNAGTAFNLRGLGAGATLTLINGRRLPAGGSEGSFVDASNIPLGAVDRIEILADGSSAIYGSDAVGGVVNVILLKDYAGAETVLQGGTVTDGNQGLIRASQLLGGSWNGGRGLLSFEYFKRDALAFAERDYLRSSDLRGLGGSDFRLSGGNPGNIIIGDRIFAIPTGQDGRSLVPSDLIEGASNSYNQNEGRTVLSQQEKQNVFGSISFEPSDRVEISADAFYTQRESESRSNAGIQLLTVPSTHPFFVDPVGGNTSVIVEYALSEDFGPRITTSDLQTWSASLGASIQLAGTWVLNTEASYADETSEQIGRGGSAIDFAALNAALNDPNPETTFNPFGDGSNTSPATIAAIRSDSLFETDSAVWEVRAVTTGKLFDFGGRAVRLAAGADHREVEFSGVIPTFDFVTADSTRRVTSLFGELYIPLLNTLPQGSAPGMLELSIAGRYEDYSDFGSTSVPKIGLTWRPLESWTFNASWGESFKAPNLADLATTNNGVFFTVEPDPSTGGSTATLIAFGKNSDLTPETAKTWRFGATLAPKSLPAFRVEGSYYEIEFSDRIVEPLVDGFSDLGNPLLEGLVTRAPTAAEIAALCATGPLYFGPGTCIDTQAGALIDARLLNSAITRQSGIDLLSSYRFESSRGSFDFSLNATYILEYEQQLNQAANVLDIVGTVFNPTDLRLRGFVSWQNGGWTTTAFANYTSSFTDNISQPNRGVDSWTTLDLTIAYGWSEISGWLDGSRISLNVQNALDEDPPFLNRGAGGYDPQNADPTGRFVSLTIEKRW